MKYESQRRMNELAEGLKTLAVMLAAFNESDESDYSPNIDKLYVAHNLIRRKELEIYDCIKDIQNEHNTMLEDTPVQEPAQEPMLEFVLTRRSPTQNLGEPE